MKKFLLFSYIFVLTSITYSQSIYNDVIKLRGWINIIPGTDEYALNPTDSTNAAKILIKYLNGTEQNLTLSQINEQLKENIFIKKYLIEYGSVQSPDAGSFNIANVAETVKSLGNVDITNIADGFAKFLIERTKEELAIAFFDKFKKAISDDKYEEIRSLFPNTYATLTAIGDEIYNYSVYLNTLRESFETDLSGLFNGLNKLIENEKYEKYFESNPGLKSFFLSSLFVGNGLLTKEHPGKILKEFNTDQYLAGCNPKLVNAIKTVQLVSESFKSEDGGNYWVDINSLKDFFKDPVKKDLYFGLLFQRAEDIKFGNTTLQVILTKANEDAEKIKSLVNYISSVYDQIETIKGNIQKIVSAQKDKLHFIDYYNYYNSFIDFIENAYKVCDIQAVQNEIGTLKNNEEFKKLISILRTGGNIALDLNRRNYSSAIINSIQAINIVFQQPLNNETKTTLKENLVHLKNIVLKYGSFIAAVAQADSSEDVKKAIAAVALPVGSSRIKRESSFSVELNAYPGFFYGSSEITGLANSKANSYGITAPIGISLSVGKLFWPKCPLSIGFFIPFVDLGAVMAYRYENKDVSQIPTVKLKDVFSFGLFLSIGLPDIPLSINGGYQTGPNLYKVNSTDNDYNNTPYKRWSISLNVDIPILDFYAN